MEGVLSKGGLSEGVLSEGVLSGGGFVRAPLSCHMRIDYTMSPV